MNVGLRTDFVGELFVFLREEKIWWIAPVGALLVILCLLLVFGGSALAPFIYTLL